MPKGKFFFIRSKVNGFVLDVQGESRDPGTPVIMWPQKPEGTENQLWWEDHIGGTIRSKLNNLCLDLNDDNELVLNEFERDRENQQWLTAGDRVQKRSNPSCVLDIKAANEDEGATVIAWEIHDGQNQRWSFDFLEAQFFYIRSHMHGKVLDLKKKVREPGAKVIMATREDDEDSQLWYEDKHGIICDKLTDFVLDSSNDNKIRLQPYEPGNNDQLWTVHEDRIINRSQPGMALDIKGAKEKDGAKLISYPWQAHDNQRWSLDYV